ncbi:hypothetical protein DPMN_135712 [Dreissena polymorpha]|uniref:Uncharacterized protein n=1 Tax=Dreissena polymorpha TaxID=45954 RepID=A0A9D4G2D5_DREPO|nr:hypothetical protein DPMN_135712 [Dreissena polymorpha]
MEAVEEDLYSLEKKRLLLEIVLLEQKIAHDKELHELRKDMISKDHLIHFEL